MEEKRMESEGVKGGRSPRRGDRKATLKDGIVIEKNGEQTTLKEFEVLPLNAGVILDAAAAANGDSTRVELSILVKRVSIKELPAKSWNVELLKKMSMEDYSIIQNTIEEYDKVFIFTPPIVKI